MDGPDGFSRRFADVLFCAYPDWRKCAKQTDAGLEVEVPSPNENAERGLFILAEFEELTVGFDNYHTDFHTHFMQNEGQAFEAAMEFIADILAERRVVLVFSERGQLKDTMCVTHDEIWSKPWPRERRIVRSWRGTYDSESIGQ